jgi:hypothetical protein
LQTLQERNKKAFDRQEQQQPALIMSQRHFYERTDLSDVTLGRYLRIARERDLYVQQDPRNLDQLTQSLYPVVAKVDGSLLKNFKLN